MDSHSERAFLKLYDGLAEPLFRHCYFRVSSREVAEDLVQETFLRAWNYLAEGKRIENPKAFLYRTAGNLVVDHYRQRKNVSLDALAEGGYDPLDGGVSATMLAEGEQARRLLGKLEEPYRQTMLLRYIDGFSVSEIAKLLGLSQNVVSVRLHRGIAKLKILFHI